MQVTGLPLKAVGAAPQRQTEGSTGPASRGKPGDSRCVGVDMAVISWAKFRGFRRRLGRMQGLAGGSSAGFSREKWRRECHSAGGPAVFSPGKSPG